MEHKPGDKLYLDYAGKKLSYIDKETGEEIFVQVLVTCLPYSEYCFAMVPDNLKAAVIRANKYEPDIN